MPITAASVAPGSNAERASPKCVDGFIKDTWYIGKSSGLSGTFVLFKLCL
jgi:hypothetical protein